MSGDGDPAITEFGYERATPWSRLRAVVREKVDVVRTVGEERFYDASVVVVEGDDVDSFWVHIPIIGPGGQTVSAGGVR